MLSLCWALPVPPEHGPSAYNLFSQESSYQTKVGIVEGLPSQHIITNLAVGRTIFLLSELVYIKQKESSKFRGGGLSADGKVDGRQMDSEFGCLR